MGRTSPNCTRSAHRRRTARPPHPRPSHVRRHRRPRNLVNLPAYPAPSCGSVENTSRGECTIVMYVLRSQSVGELIGELIGDPRYKTRQNSENQSAGRLLFTASSTKHQHGSHFRPRCPAAGRFRGHHGYPPHRAHNGRDALILSRLGSVHTPLRLRISLTHIVSLQRLRIVSCGCGAQRRVMECISDLSISSS